MRQVLSRFLTSVCLLASANSLFSGQNVGPRLPPTSLIQSVAVSPRSFNPTSGQTVKAIVITARSGVAQLQIVDRDGFLVREMPRREVRASEPVEFVWDGRDDLGRIVPDEAYSLRVRFQNNQADEIYFPADFPAEMLDVRIEMYDRSNGVLRYILPVASRVHIQAGSAKPSAKGSPEGPVLKTIVNRAPRVEGSVIEHWPGFDESGTIYVPNLSNFVMGIAATPLPQNSVITVGNSSTTFLQWARTRTGKSLLVSRPAGHHHQGLGALDDVAPTLTLKPLNASWSADSKTWTALASTLRIGIGVTGPTAEYFLRHPGRVVVFIDGREVAALKPAGTELVAEVPLSNSDEPRTLAVNWASEFGPVAVNALRIKAKLASKS